jgi:hypothetical protein
MNTIDTQALAAAISAAVTSAVVEALGAVVEPEAKAKVTRPTRKAPARKAPAKAVTVKHLTKGNRAEFVQAHPWAKGLSTLDIAIALELYPAPLNKGWALGEGYAAKARTATPAARKAVRTHLGI